ncbi:dihydroorotase [Limnobacter litoralis]|uniref:Dihydroorotase n=1 Tax=Limnobacter litoralis TaxID=481366 RepID=A0ABQ5YNE5_9BURK|nr:dihydroorotase [Limnobacter litoralis]GLR24967.1 dihydroorotase [Limnobacter litoralis]
MRVLIKNGRVIDPACETDGLMDVAIAAGRIVSVSPAGEMPDGFDAAREIDATGLWVLPGLVDLSARLREPGYEYRATLESEIEAAMAGGVTSLCCPPDTDPVLDEPGLIEMLKFKAQQLNLTKVYPLGALTRGLAGQELTEMAELTEAGCVGFSQAEQPIEDARVLLRAMQYARSFNLTVFLRPNEPNLSRGGVAHAGAYASRMGLSGVPVMAETIALQMYFEMMRSTGARVHICRISSAKGVELIRQAKAEGLPITCDVGVHHVHLTDIDIGYFDPNAHLVPPLREQRDRDAIRQGLLDGTIDAICSDHTPVDDDFKLLPFAESEAGATGLELLLALTLKWANGAGVPAHRVVQWLSLNPAQIIKAQAGALRVGMAADLCLFDPNHDWVVGPQTLISQGKHTPFNGFPMMGKVKAAMVNGHLGYDDLSVKPSRAAA